MRLSAAIFLAVGLPLSVHAAECPAGMAEFKKGIALADTTPEKESTFRRAIELCPTLAEAHYALGVYFLRQGNRMTDAKSSLERAIALRDDVSFTLALAEVMVRSGDLQGAEETYRKLTKRDTAQGDALIGLSLVLEKQGKLDDAEETIRQVIQLESDRAVGYLNLGVILEKQGKLDDALVSYETALRKNMSDASMHVHLARVRSALGRLDEAEASARQATVLDEKNREGWLLLGTVLEKQRDYHQARAAFERAQALDGNDPAVTLNLAVTTFHDDDEEQALSLVKTALIRHPDYAPLHGVLGWMYLQRRELDLAKGALNRAVTLDGRNALAHNNLGVLYELQGEREQAQREFARAVELQPELGEAQANLKRVSE